MFKMATPTVTRMPSSNSWRERCCIEMLQILLVPDLVVNALITVLTTMHIHITGVMESLKSYFIKLVSDFLNCNMRKKVTDME